VRAVLDVNVLISALISPTGTPARIVSQWLEGGFELVVSSALVAEAQRTLALPKLRARIDQADAERFIELLTDRAESIPDPENPPTIRSSDPGDDYLLALAASEQVALVSGDDHLLALRGRAPIMSPRDFIERL
jgi:putative PIN family toxin of toxin-antitoxin system